MTCIDSSVWIDSLRGHNGEIAAHLAMLLKQRQVLLPAPVRIELLAGAGERGQARLRENFSTMRSAEPGQQTWSRMESWCERATAAGQHFQCIDLLIAALAAEADAPLWSLDRAFERMARLGFIQLYRPPA